jgi:hypothetical protein
MLRKGKHSFKGQPELKMAAVAEFLDIIEVLTIVGERREYFAFNREVNILFIYVFPNIL